MKKIDITPAPIVIPSKNIQLPERKVNPTCYEWRFTDEEKEAIYGILNRSGAQESSLNDFIFQLEGLCGFKKDLLDQDKKIDIREKRKEVLKRFKDILKDLRAIELGKMILWRYHTVDLLHDEELEPKEWNSPLRIYDIIQPIEEYIKYLEELPEIPKRHGRDPADSDRFIRSIARMYRTYIGKPTACISSKSYDGGLFFQLVQKVLHILDLPCEDPSRSIRAALKKE
jgi:hypothetical protein